MEALFLCLSNKKPLAAISRDGDGQLDPGAGDLALTAS